MLRFTCKTTFLEARPARFEPATRGLEVRIGTFTTVHQRSQILICKPNPGYGLSSMFTGVRLGCRQNCRQHQLILAIEKDATTAELLRLRSTSDIIRAAGLGNTPYLDTEKSPDSHPSNGELNDDWPPSFGTMQSSESSGNLATS